MSQEFSGEARAVQTRTLLTQNDLISALRSVGVQPGMSLLVHTSLSKLGWVCGSAPALVLALEESLGPEGTLMMPAHSGDLSNPANWQNPPVPAEWWHPIRESMPAFQPDLTPTRGMGAAAECFRKQDGTLRSLHPQVSFTARGRQADFLTRNHVLTPGMGDASPLARLYELDGCVLLLGVGHANNTSLHLSECRADYPGKQYTAEGAPMLLDGQRQWVEYEDLDYNSDDFPQIGADFKAACPAEIRLAKIGQAEARLMRQRALVDFGQRWMESNRR